MSERRDVLRGIAWRELFPWLLLFRTFRLSASGTLLLVATLGVLLTPVGWRLLGFLRPEQPVELQSVDLLAVQLSEWPWNEGLALRSADGEFTSGVPGLLTQSAFAVHHMTFRAVAPLVAVVFRPTSWGDFFYYTLGGLWTLLVWSWCGGIITRLAVVRLGRDERLGLLEAVQHVAGRWGSYATAPLFPLVGFALALLVAIPCGWLMRLDVGLLLVGILWPVLLLLGILMAVLLIGLLFGWPFMWVTISTEEIGDVFEASQRSFSYTWEKPLNYVFYGLLATLYGALGVLVVSVFCDWIVITARWAVAWGSGYDRLTVLSGGELSGLGRGGAGMIRFWEGLVTTVAVAFRFSYFWVAASAVYLLLRRDVDEQMPIDEVYVPEEHERYALPPLEEDEQGVPVLKPDANSSGQSQPRPEQPGTDPLQAAPDQAGSDQDASDQALSDHVNPPPDTPRDEAQTDSVHGPSDPATEMQPSGEMEPSHASRNSGESGEMGRESERTDASRRESDEPPDSQGAAERRDPPAQT